MEESVFGYQSDANLLAYLFRRQGVLTPKHDKQIARQNGILYRSERAGQPHRKLYRRQIFQAAVWPHSVINREHRVVPWFKTCTLWTTSGSQFHLTWNQRFANLEELPLSNHRANVREFNR